MDTKGQCAHALVTRNSSQFPVLGSQFSEEPVLLRTENRELRTHTNEKLSPK
jgi:hypothetical protein